MTKIPSSRESYFACRITGVFSFAYWPVKKGGKKGRFENETTVIGL